jgi:hypothetical protein
LHCRLSVAPSLFPGAVGQKKREKEKRKKESNQKRIKRIKKRETAAQYKWETGTDSSR